MSNQGTIVQIIGAVIDVELVVSVQSPSPGPAAVAPAPAARPNGRPARADGHGEVLWKHERRHAPR